MNGLFLKTEHQVARTFFLSLARVAHLIAPLSFSHTHAGGSNEAEDVIGTCCTFALKSHPLSQHVSSTTPRRAWSISIILFHGTSVDTELTADDWNQETHCATPPRGLLFGHLAESTPLTSYEPKTCIDVSSEHTPINYPWKRNCFNIENHDLTTTVAASRKLKRFLFSSKRQPAVVRSNYQQLMYTHGRAPTCGPALGNWCEVMSHFQVLKGLCREEKETEIWKAVSEKSSCLPCAESWIFCSRRMRSSEKDYVRMKQKWK